MKPSACVHEQAVVRAVLAGRWTLDPAGLQEDEAELRPHARTCGICAEAVTAAVLLGEHREETLRDAHVPAAGQVWWRAAVRAHAEAGHAARRRTIWLQGVMGACAVGLGAALVGAAWPSIRQAAAWMLPFRSGFPPILIAIGALACLVLTPIVVYFVLSDE